MLSNGSARSQRLRETKSTAAFLKCSGAWAATTLMNSRRPMRRFNLAKMMVGSEGTLGVVLEAKLNLVPLPKAKAVLAIQFARDARSACGNADHPGHRPSAVEVMDAFILEPHAGKAHRWSVSGRVSSVAIPALCSALSFTTMRLRTCRHALQLWRRI